MAKSKGWEREPARHSLASKGVRTKHAAYKQGKALKFAKGNPFDYLAEDPKENVSATAFTVNKIQRDWQRVLTLIPKPKGEDAEYGDYLWDYVEDLADAVDAKYPDTGASDTMSRESMWEYIMKEAGKYRMWANERNRRIGEKIF